MAEAPTLGAGHGNSDGGHERDHDREAEFLNATLAHHLCRASGKCVIVVVYDILDSLVHFFRTMVSVNRLISSAGYEKADTFIIPVVLARKDYYPGTIKGFGLTCQALADYKEKKISDSADM